MLVNQNKKPTSNRRGFLSQLSLLSGMVLLGGIHEEVFGVELKTNSAELKVLTCNIRVDLPVDEVNGNGWKMRKKSCLQVIKSQKADVIGFQEVLANQFEDLKLGLSEYFGLGFDGPEMDRYKEGYHGIAKNPIFFSKKRFELITAGSYWLSDTPLIGGSVSWESARPRNCFWVRLKDRKSGKQFRVVNLHLDHVKEEAKLKQIKLVLEESEQYPSDFIQILTGDFNAGPDSKVVSAILSKDWKDSFLCNNSEGRVEGTTHSFKPHDKEVIAKSKKIDFIFTRGPVEQIVSSVVKESYRGVLPSDHYFVTAVIRI